MLVKQVLVKQNIKNGWNSKLYKGIIWRVKK